MRAFVLTISALVMMTAQTQAIDWDTLSVNQNPVPAEATVSFSIGYPKGWHATQDYNNERHDIYFDIPTAHSLAAMICSFSQPASAVPLKQQALTEYSIWLSDGATAKEAAEKFFTDKRETAYIQKSLNPVKTSAGDSGWLVESEGTCHLSPFMVVHADLHKTGRNSPSSMV